MIKKIKITNFKGISNTREVSFAANAKRKSDKYGVQKESTDEILLTSALIGKNASGKSSFLDGITVLDSLLHKRLYRNTTIKLQSKLRRINRNKYNSQSSLKEINITNQDVMSDLTNEFFNNANKPIAFECEFWDRKKLIKINVSLDKAGIVKEDLYINNKLEESIKETIDEYESNIFKRKINLSIFKDSGFWFIYGIYNTLVWHELIKSKKIKKDVFIKWMRVSDDKIIDVEFGKEYEIENISMQQDDKLVKITYSKLSTGTKKWIVTGQQIMNALLLRKQFIYIDEIEGSWHPSLTMFIISLFNDKNINKKKSQLFFTTHSPLIVEVPFRKDAINYIDRLGNIKNLGDLGMREDLTIVKNFLSEKLASHPSKSDMHEFIESVYGE